MPPSRAVPGYDECQRLMKVPVVMEARAIISEEMMNLIFGEALCSRCDRAGGGGRVAGGWRAGAWDLAWVFL